MPHTKQSLSKTSNSVILNLFQNQSKNKKSLFSAFTLVELIVVIVILAILATIAFLSFNSYSSSARDSVRLADITNIAKGLTVQYTIGGYYILPDNAVNLYSGSIIIGYQGKAGSNTLNTIKLSANTNNTSGRDPIDNTYYTYNTNINKNRYQVTGYLENKGTIINRTGFNFSENILSSINATTYTNRFPYLKGDSIGVILNYTGTTSNPIYTPIEDITTSTGIDISSGTLTNGKVVISNNSDSFTGVSLQTMSGYTAVNVVNAGGSSDNGTSSGSAGVNCLSIKNSYPSSADGMYWIKPDSNPSFQAYCDMNTDGGGWTACMYKKTNHNYNTGCLLKSSTEWAVSDDTGRFFKAWSSNQMIYPQSGKTIWNTTWKQIKPVVSPTISGDFCLSQEIYNTGFGAFSFADLGSGAGNYMGSPLAGCVTLYDGGQYFGGHHPGCSEYVYNSSWGYVPNSNSCGGDSAGYFGGTLINTTIYYR